MTRPKTLEDLQKAVIGTWESMSVELRPAEDRTGTGKVESNYLKREFTYREGNKFTGKITLFGDNYGKMPMLEFVFEGQIVWGKAHPIAKGAYEIDYILDEGFKVTPLNEGAAQMLNSIPVEGIEPFRTGVRQNILGKAFPLFNIVEGQIAKDYDLLYIYNDMMFFGAKHVDGTPFDKPERRPHQLQIPMVRKSGS